MHLKKTKQYWIQVDYFLFVNVKWILKSKGKPEITNSYEVVYNVITKLNIFFSYILPLKYI